MRIRYGAWSGTQDPFPIDVSADAVLDELSDDLLAGIGADEAMRRLLDRGMSGRRSAGLDGLRRRVEEARRRELERMGLEGPLRQVEQCLAEILQRERTALDFSPDAAGAERKREQLDDLPGDVPGRLAALDDYQWEDARAGAEYRELVEQLRRDVAQATFGRLAGALGSMSPADLERTRDLLADLNALVAKRDRGEDIDEDFDTFKQRYRDLLPGDPSSLDDLLEELARRMAAMSGLMAGLDADQRAQLAELAAGVLGDMDLAAQGDQLRATLRRQFPELGWGQAQPGAMPTGDEAGSLSDTVDWVEHLQELSDLAQAMGQSYPGARLEDIDEQALHRLLGEEAARHLRALREIERVLEEAGAVRRHAGRLELTPRGIRALGERCIARIYDRAVGATAGSHATSAAGGGGELTGTTRPLRFGDPFRLDIGRTVRNALLRESESGRSRAEGGPGMRETAARAIDLSPEDFELAEAERRVRVATALLLDMSFSMPLRGNWVPAKRLALALQALVASKFPEDRFYVVGFSDYARRLQPRDLLATGWERVYGTNMQHAFMVARRLLAAHPGAEHHIVMVTDGEPTAHLEGDQAVFAWPPERRTLKLTLAEAARVSRTGATLNVFLLDHDPGAAAFVERMVSGYGGRIFYPDLSDLGHMVVRDFLRRRAA